MASVEGEIEKVYYTRRERSENPIPPCQGWVDPCEFCDKRFGAWIDTNEENVAKIPAKPGIFMIGLSQKNTIEVVDIILDTTYLHRVAYNRIQYAKEQVANKKSKVNNSVVMCRWMTFKSVKEKDVSILCMHWYNKGVMPKFLTTWPGSNALEKSQNLTYSIELKKWCYRKRFICLMNDLIEVLQGCNWSEPCDVCDHYFGDWKSLDDVMNKDLAPDADGIYMIAVEYSKIEEVVSIFYDAQNLKLNIRDSLLKNHQSILNILREKKFSGCNPHLLVRWIKVSDSASNDCCFLCAHWLNTGSQPLSQLYNKLPGEHFVGKNKNLYLRPHDKKWFYETYLPKQIRTSKSKQKRIIRDNLEDDLRDLNVDDFV